MLIKNEARIVPIAKVPLEANEKINNENIRIILDIKIRFPKI